MDAEAKRTVLRMFTYGLYALTIPDGEKGHAATVNWVTQASFDPPLLAVSLEKNSRSIGLVREYKVFAINVYPQTEKELAGQLGRRYANRPDKFEGVQWSKGSTGSPLLSKAIGIVECRVISETDAGDSAIFVAEIVEAAVKGNDKSLTMEMAGFRHAG